MRISRIYLKNFQALYNSTNLYEIEINRERTENRLILILGSNGSGKSSLLNEITPYPLEHVAFRNKSRIIPGTEGIKELDIEDRNFLYKIKIIYDTINSKNSCFITKIDQNTKISNELNPNGNVTNYLQILETELGLNKKFINVGYLSNSVTNFIVMKPSERNSYISEWLPDLTEFLDGYKKAQKKKNSIKKEIDNLNRDIGKMSDIDVKVELNTIESNIIELNKVLKDLNTDYNKIDVHIDILKKEDYDKISYKASIELENDKKNLFDLYNNINIKKTTLSKFTNIKSNLQNLINDIKINIKINESKFDQINHDILILRNKIDELKSYNTGVDIDDLDLNETILKINSFSKELEELLSIKNTTMKNFKSNLTFLDTMNIENILSIINNRKISINSIIFNDIYNIEDLFKLKQNVENDIINKKNEFNILTDNINNLNAQIISLKNNNYDETLLKKRPDFCNYDCGIINEIMRYVNPEKELNHLNTKLEKLYNDKINIDSKITDKTNYLEDIKNIIRIIMEVDNIIYKNIELLKLYPDDFSNIFTDNSFVVIQKINDLILMNESIKGKVSILNRIDELQNVIINLKNIENIIKINNNKSDELEKNIYDIKNKIRLKNEIYDIIIDEKEKLDFILNINKEKQILEDNINNFEKNIYDIKNKIKMMKDIKIKEYFLKKAINTKNIINKKIVDCDKNLLLLTTKKEEMKTIIISRTQLENIRNKLLEEFNELEMLLEIWSPKVGYPALQIEDFLSKLTIETNKDLDKMWDSSLRIDKFILGKDEFSIVINRSGSLIADASMCSEGERSTLSLAISFSIIKMNLQFRRYNILRFDEVDGMLDDNRRRYFLEMLQTRLIDLDIEDAWIVTHNNEFDNTNCDMIMLNGSNVSNFNNKNILFKI